jgi:hypothetical protein
MCIRIISRRKYIDATRGRGGDGAVAMSTISMAGKEAVVAASPASMPKEEEAVGSVKHVDAREEEGSVGLYRTCQHQ